VIFTDVLMAFPFESGIVDYFLTVCFIQRNQKQRTITENSYLTKSPEETDGPYVLGRPVGEGSPTKTQPL